MRKILGILAVIACLTHAVGAESDKVDVVVVGMISHGPMQPTVNAIKDVLGHYGGRVNVSWVDMSTGEGEEYAQQHGLSAHLNVLVDGRYTYSVNGKDVSFQWFEGQQWTKDDLDAAIDSELNGGSGSAPVVAAETKSANKGNALMLLVAAVAALAVAWVVKSKLRK